MKERCVRILDLGVTRFCAVILVVMLSLANAQAGTITTIASTVPGNGDLNPYGVALVPYTIGSLVGGNLLVSNFNNSQNLQGTGTTIMQISPSGTATLFAQIDPNSLPGPCPGGVGLTTALVVLQSGWVIVGSLPTTDGTAATAQAGCLLVLDNNGQVVDTFYGSMINGPWDMVAVDRGTSASLFVANVLNGTVAAGGHVVNQGTVVRVDLTIPYSSTPFLQQMTVIGSGFSERSDSAALVVGPTGLALKGHNLYIADSVNNSIAVITNAVTRNTSAGTGLTLSRAGALNDPLGLAISAKGNILSVNGGNGYLVETKTNGQQISKVLLDNQGNPPGIGALFGIAEVKGQGTYFVDDNENALNLYH